METHYIEQKKDIYIYFKDYIESINDAADCFYILMRFLDSQNINENKGDLKEMLKFVSKISNNHHRTTGFYDKIQNFLIANQKQIKQNFTNLEIFDIFKNNKLILLYLFEKDIIKANKTIADHFLSKSSFYYSLYFYQEIKSFIEEDKRKTIEQEFSKIDQNLFEKNRHLGENDSYICSLIRNDSVKDFISYVNQINLKLSKTKIKPSIFETNSFLLKQTEISLIEYAAFFGSIQIVRFLKMNDIDLNPSIWLFAIHSNNADLIHLLEEEEVEPPGDSYLLCLKESIKCHHNEIANYIETNLLNKKLNESNEEEKDLGKNEVEQELQLFEKEQIKETNDIEKTDGDNQNNDENQAKIISEKEKIEDPKQESQLKKINKETNDDDKVIPVNEKDQIKETNDNEQVNQINEGNNETNEGYQARQVNEIETNNENNDIQTIEKDQIKEKNDDEQVNKTTEKEQTNEINENDQTNEVNEEEQENEANQQYNNENIISYAFKYRNYSFFPDDFNDKFIFFYACQYDYYPIVKLILNSKEININETIISKKFIFNNVLDSIKYSKGYISLI